MSETTNSSVKTTTASVSSIRENVRDDIRSARIKHRQHEIDRLRILPAAIDSLSIKLMSFTKDDIIAIAHEIKKNKHITTAELQKLSHAFLQSSENIECFLSVTGALNVLVKEFIGSDTEKQLLAVECFCNLSLGSPMSCEIVALKVGSYLHTFLTSSNEWLVRTAVWCLTNLISVGGKTLTILLNQEIIKGLMHVGEGKWNADTKYEAYLAIELVIDHCDPKLLQQSDLASLSSLILGQTIPIPYGITMITYKLLNALDHQWNDTDTLLKLFTNSFNTLIHHVDSSCGSSTETKNVHQCILILRICSNFIAQQIDYASFILENWFIASNRSITNFLNTLIDLIRAVELADEEICGFIGNVLNSPFNEASRVYLENDGMFARVNIDTHGSAICSV